MQTQRFTYVKNAQINTHKELFLFGESKVLESDKIIAIDKVLVKY